MSNGNRDWIQGAPADMPLVEFDKSLRDRLASHLSLHERRRLLLDGRRHAAVALVVLESDRERDDREPVEAGSIDMSGVPGGGLDPQGRALDGRMVGVAGSLRSMTQSGSCRMIFCEGSPFTSSSSDFGGVFIASLS